ncbi:MAG: hypothetical protein RL213_1709 [Bacteroidota bacterium]|jgi:hypothetical protein
MNISGGLAPAFRRFYSRLNWIIIVLTYAV